MKFVKLITIIALMFVGVQTMAQSGSAPFVNSTHTYKVTGAGGTYEWKVLDATGTADAPSTAFEIKSGAASEIASILWKTIGDYTVQLTETGANGCSTVRQFPVEVKDNLFDISIANLAEVCSDVSGNIIPDDDNLGTSEKTFTITAVDIPADAQWSFDVAATVFAGTGTIELVSAADGTYDASANKVTVNAGVTSVELKVTFDNTFNGGEVSLALSNGKELKYNTPDGNTTNNTGTAIIKSMPNTTKITSD